LCWNRLITCSGVLMNHSTGFTCRIDAYNIISLSCFPFFPYAWHVYNAIWIWFILLCFLFYRLSSC
jgi:hypothetical protein